MRSREVRPDAFSQRFGQPRGLDPGEILHERGREGPQGCLEGLEELGMVVPECHRTTARKHVDVGEDRPARPADRAARRACGRAEPEPVGSWLDGGSAYPAASSSSGDRDFSTRRAAAGAGGIRNGAAFGPGTRVVHPLASVRLRECAFVNRLRRARFLPALPSRAPMGCAQWLPYKWSRQGRHGGAI